MPTPFARYLSLFLLACALILPYAVVNHTYPIPTFYAEFTALSLYLLLGAGIAFLVSTARPRVAFASPVAALVPLGFGLVLVAPALQRVQLAARVGDLFGRPGVDRVARTVAADGRDRRRGVLDGVCRTAPQSVAPPQQSRVVDSRRARRIVLRGECGDPLGERS